MRKTQPLSKSLFVMLVAFAIAFVPTSSVARTKFAAAQKKLFQPEAQTDIPGQVGSGAFGTSVTALPNGNIVVTDPSYDAPGPIADVGAVYLYNGATLALISTLTGSTANNNVGIGGITVLTNGNYLVRSQNWDNPSPVVTNVGAVTWCNATTGCSGQVSESNSLVGGTANDNVGGGITVLTNGNYVVRSQNWDNPSPVITNVGAATWGNGADGTVGLVTSSNSLIGGTAGDIVGASITALTNGNYVVNANVWDNPSPVITDVGSATWGNGLGGTVGLVTASNSLVGGRADDRVGNAITAQTNGNYVVSNSFWDNPSPVITDVGAATWGNGAGGTVGLVTASNSLVGGSTGDAVDIITALTNGNYVVRTSGWDNPSPVTLNVGAATWGNGLGGTVGLITASNSLIGGRAEDRVSGTTLTALTNGNYVVGSSGWDNPSPVISNVGAATWGNGSTGTVGVVSASNSLIGGTANNNVGGAITALTNGNYVVTSILWDNPSPVITDVGAAIWGNGSTGTVGVVSASNSLIGGTANDLVGYAITPLTNGNYVVASILWDNPSPVITDVGAATWANGTGGTVGLVTASNSLVGSTAGDRVGGRLDFFIGYLSGTKALANGNYFVASGDWDNPSPAIADAGAATWGNGTGGTVGSVTPSNSLVGSTVADQVGRVSAALTNGNYVISSFFGTMALFLTREQQRLVTETAAQLEP